MPKIAIGITGLKNSTGDFLRRKQYFMMVSCFVNGWVWSESCFLIGHPRWKNWPILATQDSHLVLQACLVKMAEYWPCWFPFLLFFASLLTRTPPLSIATQSWRQSANIQLSLPHPWWILCTKINRSNTYRLNRQYKSYKSFCRRWLSFQPGTCMFDHLGLKRTIESIRHYSHMGLQNLQKWSVE